MSFAMIVTNIVNSYMHRQSINIIVELYVEFEEYRTIIFLLMLVNNKANLSIVKELTCRKLTINIFLLV